jgi:PHP family Zn ribbon phosphoesterase
VRFVLNVEISSIYKRDGAVRKIHSLIFMPDLQSMSSFNSRLERIGNIRSDGRPILGLDCRDLLEIALETSADSFLVPAHVWTPWFSILGSKSGFDSIEECFGDLTPHIFALETGLSSDPPMNFMVSSLDRYTLISNSDTHSPSKLGREANIFEGEPGYFWMRDALRAGGGGTQGFCEGGLSPDPAKIGASCSTGSNRFLGTIEFFPEEGKYHLDGHRKCCSRLEPAETERLGGRCPVCGHAITIGVMNRVNRLADRPPGIVPQRGAPSWRLLPLVEIVAQVMGVGPQSKKVTGAYMELLRRFGPELPILWSHPIEKIAGHAPPIFVEALRRVRNGEVSIKAGFDGEYGTVQLFNPGERDRFSGQETFFSADTAGSRKNPDRMAERFPKDGVPKSSMSETPPIRPSLLNDEQLEALNTVDRAVIVQAGPGTGKTLTLTNRISNLINQRLAKPEEITAVTFTRKAAGEIRERLGRLISPKDAARCWTGTFHQLGTRILDVFSVRCLFDPKYSVISEDGY